MNTYAAAAACDAPTQFYFLKPMMMVYIINFIFAYITSSHQRSSKLLRTSYLHEFCSTKANNVYAMHAYTHIEGMSSYK